MALADVAAGAVGTASTVAPLQTVAGHSQILILGLLAVLVLPVITILFVGHLVDRQTVEEERIRRIESQLREVREELGHADEGSSSD